LTNNEMRWHGFVLRTSEERISKVSNMKVKGKRPRARLRSTQDQQVRKDVTQREGRLCVETEEPKLWEDGEAKCFIQ